MLNPDPLRHHGDAELAAGLVDFAVNVRGARPPQWLHEQLVEALDDIGHYPSRAREAAATAAVAARHRRSPSEVLLLHGAAEAFTLLARLRPTLAAVLHPSFTEPEAALRAAQVSVRRVHADPAHGFALPDIPEDADLVVLGNPTNPTSVLYSRRAITALTRPGRLVVVDEAFADAIVGEPESLGTELPAGVVVIRSLTKTWALAGLRAGYLLADAALVRSLAQFRPQWPVSTLALHALQVCSEPQAVQQAQLDAREIVMQREAMVAALGEFPELTVFPAAGPFLLVRGPRELHRALRAGGIAARRCDTFPGLDDTYVRFAVRAEPEVMTLTHALKGILR